MRALPVVALAVALVLTGTGVAFAQTPTATPTPTPTPTPTVTLPSLIPDGQVPIAQICAATGVDQVDALLAQVASNALLGQLKPLASLAVPKANAITLVDAVQLSAVRKQLNCPDMPSTTTPTVAPTTTPALPGPYYDNCAQLLAEHGAPLAIGQPGYRAALDSDHDGLACNGADGGVAVPVLTGGVNTGDGSAPAL